MFLAIIAERAEEIHKIIHHKIEEGGLCAITVHFRISLVVVQNESHFQKD